jgi:DNA-binding MarR family transcriptional regulator
VSEDGDEALPALPPLDRLFEHRARLAIAVLLAARDALSFRRLKEVLAETDGSLGAHLRRLEEAGYVAVRKEFEERKPISWYSLTAAGRSALEHHVRGLESLLAELPSSPRGRKETPKETKAKRRGR